MNSAPHRTLLFCACAVVLLAAGFAWGSSRAYDQFYSPEASLDRELVHLDFNSRVLHYANQGQPADCRRELVARMQQQIVFVNRFLPDAPIIARQDAETRLQRARQMIVGSSPVARVPVSQLEGPR